MSMALLLVLSVVLGYISSSKYESIKKLYRVTDWILSASVLIIVFTVSDRAGFILRSSGSWSFLVSASVLFSIFGILFSLLFAFIVSWIGDRSW